MPNHTLLRTQAPDGTIKQYIDGHPATYDRFAFLCILARQGNNQHDSFLTREKAGKFYHYSSVRIK